MSQIDGVLALKRFGFPKLAKLVSEHDSRQLTAEVERLARALVAERGFLEPPPRLRALSNDDAPNRA